MINVDPSTVLLALGVGLLVGLSGWTWRLLQLGALALVGVAGWAFLIEGNAGLWRVFEALLLQAQTHSTVIVFMHLGATAGIATLYQFRRNAR
jgi:hypothetical protein